MMMVLVCGVWQCGVCIVEECVVIDFVFEGFCFCGVEIEYGCIECDRVVFCIGFWILYFFFGCRFDVLLYGVEYYYLIIELFGGFDGSELVLRDFDGYVYYCYEVGDKLFVGFFELQVKFWVNEGFLEGFCFGKLCLDWQYFELQFEVMVCWILQFVDIGIELFFNGLELFIFDDNVFVGEVFEMFGFFVVVGFNLIGIQLVGGVGKVIVEWICDEVLLLDLWEIDVVRVQFFQSNCFYFFECMIEMFGLFYVMYWLYCQKEMVWGLR